MGNIWIFPSNLNTFEQFMNCSWTGSKKIKIWLEDPENTWESGFDTHSTDIHSYRFNNKQKVSDKKKIQTDSLSLSLLTKYKRVNEKK